MQEEEFEDVGLNEGTKQAEDLKQHQAKKRGIFARFGDNNSESQPAADAPRPNSSHRGFHLPGRKRGQSGQGSELGNIDQPVVKENGNVEVK